VSVAGSGVDTAWTISVVAGGVKFNTHLLGLGTGERVQVSASFVDDAGQPLTAASGLRWSSSAPQVAQVDADGMVNATGFGRAAIIGTSSWGRADTLTVLVQGELLVSSTRAGTWDLYALDRRAPTIFNRLTSFPSTEVRAVYGPGGTTIVYVSSNDNNQDLYALDADGAKPVRLTNTPAQEDAPDITPDGKKVVYASNATGSYQVWIMNLDGSDQKRLTEGPGVSFQPTVSPDGRTIAFASNREGNYDVYQMNLDGTNPRSLLKTPAKEMSPQWLPNGHIAFLQEQRAGIDRKGPVVNVVVKRDATTGQLSNLTPLSHNVSDFAVSSQGDFLALIATAAGQGGNTPGRLFLLPILPGATPTEVPLSIPKERVFSPSFRK
jgi:Tol biopolymer transport system component